VCVRLANAKLESDRLREAADGDKSNQPERLAQLLTEMRNERDKVLCLLVNEFRSDICSIDVINVQIKIKRNIKNVQKRGKNKTFDKKTLPKFASVYARDVTKSV